MDDLDKVFQSKAYPIVWIEGRVLFGDLPRPCQKIMFGVCGYSKRICKSVSPRNILTILIINDTYISKNQCEEEHRCIDFDCPLNKTTKEDYAQRYHISLKKVPPDFGKTLPINRAPDGSLYCFSDRIQGKEAGTIITYQRKKLAKV